MNIILVRHINRWLKGEKSYPERYLKSTGKRDSWSLQQMATCAGRKKMVFSFLLHVCQPPLVCCFHSRGRDLFTTLAVSVFPLCLILEKQIWGFLAQKALSAVCITLRKQKVFKIALYRYLPFSSLLALSLHFFLFSCILSIADLYSHAVWFSFRFCELKRSYMPLCCETSG